jgi:DNA-binding response OmpR family regulator
MNPERKLLIVENNPLIAEAFERVGERLQMRADVATDGWEAIELLRNADYAAIVIDADLPRRSGLGVLTWLRQETGALDHVLLMTSSDREALRRRVDERHLEVVSTTDQPEQIAAMLARVINA